MIKHLIKQSDNFKKELWKLAGQRFTENLIVENDEYKGKSYNSIRQWLSKGHVRFMVKDEEMDVSGQLVVVLSGKVCNNDAPDKECAELSVIEADRIKANDEAIIFIVESFSR